MGRAQIKTDDTPAVADGIRQILERATKNGVSDVHIEPGEQFVLVRYRRGGRLYTANKLPKSAARPVARHFKKLAGLDTAQTLAPQTGQYELTIGHHKYSLQVATLPALDGEKITISIDEKAAAAPNLESLGLWGDNLVLVERALAQPKGLLIVTGRQSNRMITTLAAMVQTLEAASGKLGFILSQKATTVLPTNIEQFAIRPKTGLSAARQLQILLKEDFDIIGIDQMTDHDIAEGTIEAALAKHLILVGLAASNAMSGLKSLQQISRSHLAPASVSLVVGQSFARSLCQHCREAYEPSPVEQIQLANIFHIGNSATMKGLHELEKTAAKAGLGSGQSLGSSEKRINQLWRADPHGCEVCDYTGFAADIGIFEVCKPSEHLRKQLADNELVTELQKTTIKDGTISLTVDALIKALRGQIDFPALLSICADVE